jgi:hypothetical protein
VDADDVLDVVPLARISGVLLPITLFLNADKVINRKTPVTYIEIDSNLLFSVTGIMQGGSWQLVQQAPHFLLPH